MVEFKRGYLLKQSAKSTEEIYTTKETPKLITNDMVPRRSLFDFVIVRHTRGCINECAMRLKHNIPHICFTADISHNVYCMEVSSSDPVTGVLFCSNLVNLHPHDDLTADHKKLSHKHKTVSHGAGV